MTVYCTTLPEFDMVEFVRAGLSLSIVNVVWFPPGSSRIRVDTRNPVFQTERGWKELSELYCWADRTDPGSLKRYAFYKKAWEEREPGEDIVVIDKIELGTACVLSL